MGALYNPWATFLQSIIELIRQIGKVFDVGPFEGPYIPESHELTWCIAISLEKTSKRGKLDFYHYTMVN